MITIGVIGNGFVGKATSIFKCKKVKLYNYDIVPELCFPLGTTLKDICNQCDIILVSVPTPMNKDGSCYLKIVETVVGDISKHVDLNEKIVVLRSTVPPGTSDRLNCYFMPEFLTEKNFMNDFKNNPNWIFGLKGTKQDIIFKEKIFKLINFSHVFEKICKKSINIKLKKLDYQHQKNNFYLERNYKLIINSDKSRNLNYKKI